MWTQTEAIYLCKKIEAVCPKFGCHVALTGGLLYKEGPRKDADIMFYRIRQVEAIDKEGLWAALASLGITVCTEPVSYGHSFVIKATYRVPHAPFLEPQNIDFFFPEGSASAIEVEEFEGLV